MSDAQIFSYKDAVHQRDKYLARGRAAGWSEEKLKGHSDGWVFPSDEPTVPFVPKLKTEEDEEYERQDELCVWQQNVMAEAITLANKKIGEYIATQPASKPVDPDPFEERESPKSVFQVFEAADFAGGEHAEPEWQVHQLVPLTGTGLDTGASKTLKSFKVLEVATCINRGTPYQGLPVRKGRAVIIVAEGAFGYPLRMKALAKHLGCDVSELPAIIPAAPNLYHAEQIEALIVELKKRGATYVAFDTKWRCSVGAEENSAKDTAIVFGAMERISKRLGCFVTAISHTGLADGTRIRGSSSQFAAVDVEILHERNGDIATSTVQKLKDGPDEGRSWTMKTKFVELGISKKTGEPFGSLVLEATNEAPVRVQKRPRFGSKPYTALIAIEGLMVQGVVNEIEARAAVAETKGEPGPGEKDRRNARAKEEIDALVRQGFLFRRGKVLSLTDSNVVEVRE